MENEEISDSTQTVQLLVRSQTLTGDSPNRPTRVWVAETNWLGTEAHTLSSEQATALRPGTGSKVIGASCSNKVLEKVMFAQQTITGRRTAAWNEPTRPLSSSLIGL